MSFEIAELQRQFFNLVKIGTVHSVDYKENMARVEFGKVVTDYLPWITTRAGLNQTYNSLDVGEQVLVLTPPGGANGIIIGSMYREAHPAPAKSAEIQKTIYKDGSTITYDREHHVLTADIQGDVKVHTTKSVTVNADENIIATAKGDISATADKDINVKAKGSVVIDAGTKASITAPQIELNGQTVINGTMSQGGGSNGGDATFNGTLHTIGKISTGDDVSTPSVSSLNGHSHHCNEGGTGSPK